MSPTYFRRPIYVRQTKASVATQDVDDPELTRFHQSVPLYARSPLVAVPDLAKELNVKAVFVKDESSRFGLPSFKLLGASWGVFRAVAAKTGLSTQSSLEEVSVAAQKNFISLFAATDGNHGRAIAYMAKLLHIPATIYVPHTVDQYTRKLITGEGANLVRIPSAYDTAVAAATLAAKKPGGILVQDTAFKGYEQIPAWIIDGYSALMQEASAQLAELGLEPTTVVAPVGVGSIAQAIVNYCKADGRDIQCITIEPDTSACFYKSLRAGESITVNTSHTIMNGMDCGTMSTTAWPILKEHVDLSVTVSDYESHQAVQFLQAQGLNSGPCGAGSLAALRRIVSAKQEGASLSPDAVVVLFSTEARRPYHIPFDVSCEDPTLLAELLTKISEAHLPPSAEDEAGEDILGNYISAWLAHRDIEPQHIEPVPGCLSWAESNKTDLAAAMVAVANERTASHSPKVATRRIENAIKLGNTHQIGTKIARRSSVCQVSA